MNKNGGLKGVPRRERGGAAEEREVGCHGSKAPVIVEQFKGCLDELLLVTLAHEDSARLA